MNDDALYAARVGLLDFVIGALRGPPTTGFVETLFADEVSGVGDVNEPLDEGFEVLAEFFAADRGRPPEMVVEELAAEYDRLFAGSDPLVNTREAAYRAGVDEAAIEEHYDAVDWSPPSASAPDALVVELAFLRALLDDQRAGREGSVGHERAFLDDHLSQWADDFAASCREHGSSSFYRATAALVEGIVTLETDVTARLLAER